MNCPYCLYLCRYDETLDDYWCHSTNNDPEKIGYKIHHFFESSPMSYSLYVKKEEIHFVVSKYSDSVMVHDDVIFSYIPNLNERNIKEYMDNLVNKTLKLKSFL